MALVVVAALATGLAGGWVAADSLRSPDQRAAEARPPAATPIVEAVVVDELVDRLSVRVTVEREVLDRLAAPVVTGDSVVTSVPVDVGATLSGGSVVATINGRPLFVFPGAFRLYRDIGPGDVGPDVGLLQAALAAAGVSIPGSELGTFGTATQRGVQDLYRGAGFSAPTREVTASDAAPADPDPGTAEGPATSAPLTEVYLPKSEVLVAQRLPATAASLPAIGDVLGVAEGADAFVTLASGALLARADVAASVGLRVEPGANVELVGPTADPVGASVTAVSPVPGDEDSAGGFQLVITPDAAIPEEWLAQELLAEVTIEVVAEEGLVVPTRAISVRSDGTSTVSRRRDGGDFTVVEVREVGSLAGRSAVVPLEAGALAEGDEARVA